MNTKSVKSVVNGSAFNPSTYSNSWLSSLTQQPEFNPDEINSLEVNIGQAVHEWLLDNAPAEICELMNAQGLLRQFVREYEFSRGCVSANANANAERAIRDAHAAAESLGLSIDED